MFEKYSEYKDSGVEWLGDIPKHWDIKKTFHYFKAEKGRNAALLTKEYCGKIKGDYPVYSGQTENNGIMSFIDNYEYDFSVDGCLFSTTVGAKAMTVGYLNEKFSLSQNCMIIVKRNGFIYNKFFYYLFQPLFKHFRSQIPDHMQASFRMEDLYQYRIVLPPIFEQQIIANFLDRKTAQIDQAISIKEKQIELLRERRQILIHNAVTRGLDLDVKMKDSGVDGGDRRWIGEIPEHWEVFANRVLFTERNQPGREGLPLLSVSIHTAISSDELDEESNIRGKVKIEDKSNYKLVEVNDIVFNMMRAWQGAIGAVGTKGMVSPAYVVARPNRNIDANYAEYQFRTSIYIQEMNRVSKGITDFRKRLYWHEFKQLTTVVPPYEEQKDIVSYIENINQKIATAISLKQKEIEKLKEYKSTLINSAVTGKIKV